MSQFQSNNFIIIEIIPFCWIIFFYCRSKFILIQKSSTKKMKNRRTHIINWYTFIWIFKNLKFPRPIYICIHKKFSLFQREKQLKIFFFMYVLFKSSSKFSQIISIKSKKNFLFFTTLFIRIRLVKFFVKRERIKPCFFIFLLRKKMNIINNNHFVFVSFRFRLRSASWSKRQNNIVWDVL